MTAIQLRFAPESAKAAGLLEQLLAFHGLAVSASPLSSGAGAEAVPPCVTAVSLEAADSSDFSSLPGWTMVMNPDPAAPPPEGMLEFTREGVEQLVERLRSGGCATERRRATSDRRTWDIRRFRFGLWLAFSRATGAGKFDVFPLTYSKRMKARQALIGELDRYEYQSARPAGELLDEALEALWESEALGFPTAIRIVEAVADAVWHAGEPRMAERRRAVASV